MIYAKIGHYPGSGHFVQFFSGTIKTTTGASREQLLLLLAAQKFTPITENFFYKK